MSIRWRLVLVAFLVPLFLLSLSGCGDRKCLDYDTQIVSTLTIVNGKPVPGTSVVTHCVQYEEVKSNG
ncbi:hypothetical protein [Streptomyces toxytricini]|uniref:hypothetical protein n=1 Tax=Streptomyces toxytricini TaxID=67369 RepID=UPI00342062DA